MFLFARVWLRNDHPDNKPRVSSSTSNGFNNPSSACNTSLCPAPTSSTALPAHAYPPVATYYCLCSGCRNSATGSDGVGHFHRRTGLYRTPALHTAWFVSRRVYCTGLQLRQHAGGLDLSRSSVKLWLYAISPRHAGPDPVPSLYTTNTGCCIKFSNTCGACD